MNDSKYLVKFLTKSGIIKNQKLPLYDGIKNDINLSDIAEVNKIDEKNFYKK